jgi:hypothetical protein
MEPLTEAPRRLRRPSELEAVMQRRGGLCVTEERALYLPKDSLRKYPAAVRAILDASKLLPRTVDSLSVADIGPTSPESGVRGQPGIRKPGRAISRLVTQPGSESQQSRLSGIP